MRKHSLRVFFKAADFYRKGGIGMIAQLLLSSLIIGVMIGFQGQTDVKAKSEGKPMQISIKSPAFAEGDMIPQG